MKPFAFRLVVSALLIVCADQRSQAQVLDRVCPPDDAGNVFARPVFAWAFGSENLLTNPGFEEGTNGWELSPGGVIITSPPNGAAEGVNAFRVSVGRISREVTLPTVDGGLSFSFALRGLVQLVGPEVVEVEPADGSAPPVKLPIAGFTSQARWTIHTADVSAYRGQTVRFTWNFPAADGVPWYLDDVRITPVAPATEFEVWWRRNRAAAFELLERTSSPSITFPELLPNVRHDWRVDVIRNGTTNVGSMLTFTTANAFGPEKVTGASLPPIVCPDQPVSVGVRVTDERGFPARSAVVTLNFAAAGPTVNPPGVLITEVDTGVPDGVEFQNVSDEAVDLSGWQVELFRMVDTTFGGKITIPQGSVLPPGARFTITDDRPRTSPWPSLGVQVLLDWAERQGAALSAGAVLRNATGEVIDAVFIEPGPRLIEGQALPRNSRSVAPADWRTLPISLVAAEGETYQRLGETDQNVAADWALAPRSFDQANAGMSDRFFPGFGALPITPRGLTNVRTGSDGWIQVPARISGAGSNIIFQAQLRTLNALGLRLWESNPFQVNPAACLQVSLPSRVDETAGVLAGALRLQLPEPTATNLTLQLSANSPRLGLPSEVVIAAGQSEASIDLTILDDSALTGGISVTVTVAAPGFSAKTGFIIIDDDETTTMRWEIPDQVVEGTTVEAQLVLGRPVDALVAVPLNSANLQRLSAQPFAVFPAGSDRAVVSLSATDNSLLDGPASVELTASIFNWESAIAAVSVVDNDTNTIDLVINFNEPVVEGQTVDLAITLGGGSPTNLPMTIVVSNPSRMTPPFYPEFPAIGTGINVSLMIADDAFVTGREEVYVEVSLPGYITSRRSFIIQDNDPGRLELTQPTGPHYIDGNVVASVQAQTLDGDPLPQVDLSTAAVSLVGDGPLSFQAMPPFLYEASHIVSAVPKTATHTARLRVEALGLQVESLPFGIWPTLTVVAPKWANYDAARDRLIIIPETGDMFAVAAATGARTDFSTPLNDADFAVMTDDGQTLNVVHADRRRIARINLASLALEADWEMDMHPEGRPLRVDHLAAVPGSQALVVCRRYARDASPPEPDRLFDLVVFDGPTIRPGRILLEGRNFLGATVIVPNGAHEVQLIERNRIFAYGLDAQGLADGPASFGDFVGHDYGLEGGTAVEVLGTVLTRRGQWLDPRLPGELAYTSLGFDDDIFGFDPARGVVAWYKSGDRPMLRLLSPHNLQVLAALALGPAERLTAPVVRLEPAGPDRWLLVHNRRVHLIPIAAPAPQMPVDLGMTATVTDQDPHLATARIVFRVTNQGSQPATGVELSLGLPRGAYSRSRPAYWLEDSSTHAVLGLNALRGQNFALGNLEPNASVELALVIPADELGAFAVSAVVGTAAPDPDPVNNRVETRFAGLMAPPPMLRFLPKDQADPERLFFEYTTRYDHLYRVERAPKFDGLWEAIGDQDLIGRGLPERFDAGKYPSDGEVYWRVRRTWPE